jgi:uncharacterized surface protein with fasciclin (FAS1) repeats
MKRLFLKMTAAAAVGALVGACGGTDDGDDKSPGSLIDVAFRSGEISALVTAARLAGLESALDAPDANLTVLAPTNEAWALLAGQFGFRSIQAMLEALQAANVLESILRYHVLPTRVSKADLLAAPTQATLLVQDGSTIALPLATAGGETRITDTIGRFGVVNLFDVPADNGVFHVIDRVLIPTAVLTVLQTVQSNPERFRELSGAIGNVPSLVTTLNGSGPFTLFAPVNSAFLVPAVAALLPTLLPAQLTTLLQYHVLGQRVLSGAIPFGTPVATLAGQNITINAGGSAIARIDDTSATDANITTVDILASNGVVHVIDKVLLPTL